MKKIFFLISLLSFSYEASAITRTFYLKFRGETDSQALDKVDEAIVGIKNGRYRYRHQPLRVLYNNFGCQFTRPEFVSLEAVTVKKGYRINRRGNLETFRQATVKVAHKRCTHNND